MPSDIVDSIVLSLGQSAVQQPSPRWFGVVGVGGKLHSGKDVVADTLVEYGWTKFGMSDPINELLRRMSPFLPTGSGEWLTYEDAIQTYGYRSAKNVSEVRRLLQDLGEGAREIVHPDTWTNAMRLRIAEYDGPVVITRTNRPNELDVVRDRGGFTIYVERPGLPPNDHSSDDADPADFDAVLVNDGTVEDLQQKVRTLLRLDA